jgi:hypothetical protein
LQTDPIGYGGGDLNLYNYVGNDPVNSRDPLGLYRIPFRSSGAYWSDVAIWGPGIANAYWYRDFSGFADTAYLGIAGMTPPSAGGTNSGAAASGGNKGGGTTGGVDSGNGSTGNSNSGAGGPTFSALYVGPLTMEPNGSYKNYIAGNGDTIPLWLARMVPTVISLSLLNASSSAVTNQEYVTLIFLETLTQQYSAGDVHVGAEGSAHILPQTWPSSSSLLGAIWHTHSSASSGDNLASAGDVDTANLWGLPNFWVTSNGEILVYVPNTLVSSVIGPKAGAPVVPNFPSQPPVGGTLYDLGFIALLPKG